MGQNNLMQVNMDELKINSILTRRNQVKENKNEF